MPKNISGFSPVVTLPKTPRPTRTSKRQDSSLRLQVANFVQTNVPPSNTVQSNAWKVQAKSLGKEAASYLVDVLRNGDEEEQYSALLALRENGYEAWGHGYNADFEYRVTINGKEVVIKPEHYEIVK